MEVSVKFVPVDRVDSHGPQGTSVLQVTVHLGKYPVESEYRDYCMFLRSVRAMELKHPA